MSIPDMLIILQTFDLQRCIEESIPILTSIRDPSILPPPYKFVRGKAAQKNWTANDSIQYKHRYCRAIGELIVQFESANWTPIHKV